MSVVVTDYYGWARRPYTITSTASLRRTPCSTRSAPPNACRAAKSERTRRWRFLAIRRAAALPQLPAELQPSYAPELNIRGTYAGVPPANPLDVLNSPGLNGEPTGNGRPGGAAIGLIGYVINGVNADYPESRPVIDQTVNLRGVKFLKDVAQQCVGATILDYAYDDSRSYLADGQSISTVINSSPVLKGIAEEQTIGTPKPQAPVLLVSNINDDLLPHKQVRQLADEWCAKGATVKLDTALIPPLIPSTIVGHAVELIPGIDAGEDWISDRFAGKPAPNSCGSLS